MITLKLFVCFLLMITVISLSSCSDGKLRTYERMVQEADKFEIFYKATDKTITVPARLVGNFKKNLTRNVNLELQRKFINDVRIDIYKGNKRIAFLLIVKSRTNPFVNFNSERMHFGFKLTYGIGQTIDHLAADSL